MNQPKPMVEEARRFPPWGVWPVRSRRHRTPPVSASTGRLVARSKISTRSASARPISTASPSRISARAGKRAAASRRGGRRVNRQGRPARPAIPARVAASSRPSGRGAAADARMAGETVKPESLINPERATSPGCAALSKTALQSGIGSISEFLLLKVDKTDFRLIKDKYYEDAYLLIDDHAMFFGCDTLHAHACQTLSKLPGAAELSRQRDACSTPSRPTHTEGIATRGSAT